MLEWLRGMAVGGSIMPPLDHPAEEEAEENSLDPALLQLGPSDPAETTAVEPPVPEINKRSYPVVIPYISSPPICLDRFWCS